MSRMYRNIGLLEPIVHASKGQGRVSDSDDLFKGVEGVLDRLSEVLC